MKLPRSVQEIADVIGRERTLFLIGQLPRCMVRDNPSHGVKHRAGGVSERVMLYVPKVLKPDHNLVRILGWHEAQALVAAFGGEMLAPGNCREVYRVFRDGHIARLVGEGVPHAMVADWFGVSEKLVRNVSAEIPQVGLPKAANDNVRRHTLKLPAPRNERKR